MRRRERATDNGASARPSGVLLLARILRQLVFAGLVTVMLLLVGWIAIPPLCDKPSKAALWGDAIRTLQCIAGAEADFRRSAVVDRDRDGVGEYGGFAELTARSSLPGPRGEEGESALPAAFTRLLVGGVVEHGGFLFRIDLPSSPTGGRSLPARGEGVDPALAEDLWQAYAWPADPALTGAITFHIDWDGRVRWMRAAHGGGYAGLDGAPPFDAALTAARPGDLAAPPADGIPANDGNVWELVPEPELRSR